MTIPNQRYIGHLRRFPLLLAVAALVALTVASCGSSTSDSSGTSDADPTSASTEPASSTSDISTVAEDIPGSEEFGLTMEGLALAVEQVEEAIGSCMAAAGFDYVPVDFDTIREAQNADGTLPGVSDDDFLAQYGFGITTLVDRPNAMVEIAKGQNAALFAELSEADQVAYTRTLLGENGEWFVVGLEEEDLSETGGCTRQAVEQFFTEDQLSGSYVNPGDTLIENDPRMADAIDAWSTCLAEDGFDYDDPDDLDDDLADRLDAIVGDADPGELTGTAADALTELQGFERAIAEIAEDCQDEHIDPVEERIETELYGAPQG